MTIRGGGLDAPAPRRLAGEVWTCVLTLVWGAWGGRGVGGPGPSRDLHEKNPSCRWVNTFPCSLGSYSCCLGRVLDDRASALERRPAAFDVAPRRPAGPRGVPLRRLDGGRGADLVAGAAARSARSVPLAVQGALGICRLAGVPGFAACLCL